MATKIIITTNGKSQEMPDPLCRAAIEVGAQRGNPKENFCQQFLQIK